MEENFKLFNADGFEQFSNQVDTIALTSVIQKNSGHVLTEFSTKSLTVYTLLDGQYLEFRETSQGLVVDTPSVVNTHLFENKRGPSNYNHGLQLFDADGLLTYCAIRDKPLRVEKFIQLSPVVTTNIITTIPAQYCGLIILSSSSRVVVATQGSELNPGFRTTITNFNPIIARVGNTLQISIVKRGGINSAFWSTWAHTTNVGLETLDCLLIDMRNYA